MQLIRRVLTILYLIVNAFIISILWLLLCNNVFNCTTNRIVFSLMLIVFFIIITFIFSKYYDYIKGSYYLEDSIDSTRDSLHLENEDPSALDKELWNSCRLYLSRILYNNEGNLAGMEYFKLGAFEQDEAECPFEISTSKEFLTGWLIFDLQSEKVIIEGEYSSEELKTIAKEFTAYCVANSIGRNELDFKHLDEAAEDER